MRATSKVKCWNQDRHFGFLWGTGRGDLFVHLSDMESGIAPQVNDLVSFEIVETERGLRATEARIEHDQQ
jgi:cold shock CspA family protein